MTIAGFDPTRLVVPLAVAAALLILYGSRISKGGAKQTPEGLAFPLKPIFIGSRIVFLPAYIGFFLWLYWRQSHALSWPILLIGVLVLVIGFLQMPATITLTETGITQQYWLRPLVSVRYDEVQSLQAMHAGRVLIVVSRNGTRIRHSGNHVASQQFRSEIERRTGRRAT